MPTYETPGVYYERIDVSAPVISPIRTDITGFVGIADRGPIDVAVPIQSWRQFQAYFGGCIGSGFLAYSVRAFFENGGKRCWIVRVASRDPVGGAKSAAIPLQTRTGKYAWEIAAFSPGSWGNDLSIQIKETHHAQTKTDPKLSKPNYSKVVSTTGFTRGTMVRLSQPGVIVWKVISEVDPIEGSLTWVHQNPALRLPYDSVIQGFDPDQSILIESVEYTLSVKMLNKTVALYEGLSLIPENQKYGPRILPIFTPLPKSNYLTNIPLAPSSIVIFDLRIDPNGITDPSLLVEPLYPGKVTKINMIIDPTHIRVESITDIRIGSLLELMNPSNRATIGEALKVVSIDSVPNLTLTLEESGLSVEQQAAEAAAVAQGEHLRVGINLRYRKLQNGADGLSLLNMYDFTGEEIHPLDSDLVKTMKRRGIRALADVDEVAIVAVPDIHIQPIFIPPPAPLPPCVPDPCLPFEGILQAVPSSKIETELPPVFSDDEIFLVQAALVQHCEERRDRIALLDPPISASKDDELGLGAIQAWRKRFDSKYAALYYPWIRVVDPLRSPAETTRDVPPSGHIAGQYARTDFEVGVHKAPANFPIAWIQDVTVVVNEASHGILNPNGINVIRAFAGRGIRIFGARTISSDTSWRFVNVRRLIMMIEKAIYISTQWAVFEPNDVYTRTKLRLSLASFLLSLWQKGALMGKAPEEAFFVRCDEENNPPAERDNGRLLAEVGVSPSNPFEFVVLRVGRTNNEFEITEVPLNSGEI